MVDLPVTLFEELRAEAAMKYGEHSLADFGIHPITSWALTAVCPKHGLQTMVLEESTELPEEDSYITCFDCAGLEKVRWIPVVSWSPVEATAGA